MEKELHGNMLSFADYIAIMTKSGKDVRRIFTVKWKTVLTKTNSDKDKNN